MSWSVSIPSGAIEDFDATMEMAIEAANVPAQNPAAGDQVQIVKEAASNLARTGVFVGPGQKIGGSIAGHHSPIEPNHNWISISFYRAQ